MANWTDGPEYAPHERPAAFHTPDTPPLDVPADPPNPAANLPVEHPSYAAPSVPTPDLAAIAPPPSQAARDPREAFSVVQAAVTSSSAWTAAHSTTGTLAAPTWDPTQPLTQTAITTITYPTPAPNFPPPQVNQTPFPQPGTTDWFAPPGAMPPPGPPQVTFAQLWRVSTAGVLIPLLIGGVIPSLSMIMLALSFSMSGRITRRRRHVRLAYGIATLVVFGLSGLSLFDDSIDLPMFWDVLSGWARWVCWGLFVAIPLIVGAALRNNEPEDRGF